MELLKKILRHSFKQEALRVTLKAGQVPEVITATSTFALSDLQKIDKLWLKNLYGFLFPNDQAKIATGQTTRGVLNISNAGQIMLIAQPVHPESLKLYLPAGHANFESDWKRLSSKTVILGQAPKPVATPTSPPKKGGRIPFQIDQDSPQESLLPDPDFDFPEAGAAEMPEKIELPVKDDRISFDANEKLDLLPQLASSSDEANLERFSFVPDLASAASQSKAAEIKQPESAPPSRTTIDTGFDYELALKHAPKAATPQPQKTPDFGLPPLPQAALAPSIPLSTPIHEAVQPTPPPSLHQPMPEPQMPLELNFSANALGEIAVSLGENPIDEILANMVQQKASDLHLTTDEPLCFRIDGDIFRMGNERLQPELMKKYLEPIIPAPNKAEFAVSHDTDFAYEVTNIGRFRVNVFRDKNGVGAVLRHIPNQILTTEQLGLPPSVLKLCQLSKGLVLVTGPTGSGKSTTLAAMIDRINRTRAYHIVTIEDPIEFVHTPQRCLINQREVYKHTKSFSRALKAALREDPDIILIGEMRDLETVSIALETAETGHLVFGTLHTTTAVSTIDRIIDQFAADQQQQIRMMLASSLRGVIAQTLLRKKSGGRIAAHEILITNDAVSAMVREGKNHMIQNHMQTQKQDGNLLLNEALSKLVKEDVVEAEEAYRKAVDKGSLMDMFKRLGIKI